MSKINLFQDKVYDGLDWLEMAVEPYICPINDILGILPDSIPISLEDLVEMEIFSSINHINHVSVVNFVVKKHNIKLDASQVEMIESFLEIQFSGSMVFVDLEDMTIQGEIFLVKKANHLEDEDIKAWLNTRVQSKLRSHVAGDISRISEIQDLLGCKDTSKSVKNKMKTIHSKMEDIVLKDEWRVRDTQLMESAAKWIIDYVNAGNLASLSNFTRLKCMVHKNAPIYSMEETK